MTRYAPDVEEGDIIFFPANLLHYAPTNLSKITRIILSFNLMIEISDKKGFIQLKITIPISVGELIDKISILQIKSQNTDSPYVSEELKSLTIIANENEVFDEDYFIQLLDVNQLLWKVEDDLRALEKEQDFSEEFVKLARNVYKFNDIRSSIKKEINEKYNSIFSEVKIYK